MSSLHRRAYRSGWGRWVASDEMACRTVDPDRTWERRWLAALWLLPVGVEATVLTSLTLSACVWSIDYLVSAISPELGSELSSMGDILSAAFS